MKALFVVTITTLLGVYCLLFFYSAHKNRRIIQDISGTQLPADAKVAAYKSKDSGLGMSGIRVFKIESKSYQELGEQSCADRGFKDLGPDDVMKLPELRYVGIAKRACIRLSRGKLDGFSIVQDRALIVVALY